jgi:chromatin remodeling complex protein RSC6
MPPKKLTKNTDDVVGEVKARAKKKPILPPPQTEVMAKAMTLPHQDDVVAPSKAAGGGGPSVAAVVEEVAAAAAADEASAAATSTGGEKKRLAPPRLDKETLMRLLDDIVVNQEKEVERIRGFNMQTSTLADMKVSLIKNTRTSTKNVKLLRNYVLKLCKNQRKTKKNGEGTTNNSGLLKPVRISAEMAEFAGFEPNELKSRNDVTDAICQYIKKNNLQNPKDRREIIVDSRLSKVLRFDPEVEPLPLTYFRVQLFMRHHFDKTIKEKMAEGLLMAANGDMGISA